MKSTSPGQVAPQFIIRRSALASVREKCLKVLILFFLGMIVVYFSDVTVLRAQEIESKPDLLQYQPDSVQAVRGPIVSMHVFVYTAREIDGIVQRGAYPYGRYAVEFDSSGKLKLNEHYVNDTGMVWYPNVYPIDPEEVPPLQSGHLVQTFEYTGARISGRRRVDFSNLYREEWRLDASGRTGQVIQTLVPVIPETQIPDHRHSTVRTVGMTRDATGRVLQRTYHEAGRLLRTDRFAYDADGRLAEYSSVEPGQEEKVRSYEYADNRLVAIQSDSLRTTFVFGRQGLSEHVQTYSGGYGNTKTYEYNSRGLVKRSLHLYPTSGQRYQTEYSYEFDANGNWTTRHARETNREGHNEPDVVSYSVVEREILYP